LHQAEAEGGDPELLAQIADVAMDIDALEMMELTVMAALDSGQNPGHVSSVLKLRASQLKQAVSELAVQVLGPAALRWEAHRPLHDLPYESDAADFARSATSRYLNSRADTIFGGAAEIQKNIIAKTILGL
jgi:acyl-CoA dehydrogenase